MSRAKRASRARSPGGSRRRRRQHDHGRRRDLEGFLGYLRTKTLPEQLWPSMLPDVAGYLMAEHACRQLELAGAAAAQMLLLHGGEPGRLAREAGVAGFADAEHGPATVTYS